MITKTVKEEAKKEAVKLRENATREELNRLDFDELRPNDTCACIYGLMTGGCFSDRATELLNLCASPFSSSGEEQYDFENGFKTKNLPKTFSPDSRMFENGFNYFSPIESLIYQGDESIKANLIAYLRGETDEFNF